jgi:hypothetical protein
VILAPALSGAFEAAYVVPLLAESALCLWLLIRGLPGRRLSAPEGQTAAA